MNNDAPLDELEVLRDVVVKLVACIGHHDKKGITKVRIGTFNKTGMVASSNPLSHYEKFIEIDPSPFRGKYILTSIEVVSELLDKRKPKEFDEDG